MADVKKTPTERLREALDNLGIRTGDLGIMCEVMRARAVLAELAAENARLERLLKGWQDKAERLGDQLLRADLSDTAETPDRRAERLLGKWLVKNPGWSYYTSGKSEDYRCRLGRGESGFYSTEGLGPTRAEAILDALRKAGCKDV
jgi:hypothetical protein